MNPAEELRAAAAKLRETAKEWLTFTPDNPRTGIWYERGSLAEALHVHVGTPSAATDEAWIVLASPVLAEPLAAWLDAEAHLAERDELRTTTPKSLAVARVINRSAP